MWLDRDLVWHLVWNLVWNWEWDLIWNWFKKSSEFDKQKLKIGKYRKSESWLANTMIKSAFTKTMKWSYSDFNCVMGRVWNQSLKGGFSISSFPELFLLVYNWLNPRFPEWKAFQIDPESHPDNFPTLFYELWLFSICFNSPGYTHP